MQEWDSARKFHARRACLHDERLAGIDGSDEFDQMLASRDFLAEKQIIRDHHVEWAIGHPQSQRPITIARSSDFMPGVTQVPREPLLLADLVFDDQYFHFPLR
jgi:hypothetical protein